jgi:hypothetical protein
MLIGGRRASRNVFRERASANVLTGRDRGRRRRIHLIIGSVLNLIDSASQPYGNLSELITLARSRAELRNFPRHLSTRRRLRDRERYAVAARADRERADERPQHDQMGQGRNRRAQAAERRRARARHVVGDPARAGIHCVEARLSDLQGTGYSARIARSTRCAAMPIRSACSRSNRVRNKACCRA